MQTRTSMLRETGAVSVGVIVPVRGESPYLAEALHSVLSQDPSPPDVVVVDDASPVPVRLDGDLAHSCRLIRRERRGGPAGARQSGLEAVQSPLVALCDSDDAWEPGKLAAQLAALERHPSAAACFGRALVVGPDGEPTGESWQEPPAGLHRGESLARLLYERNPIPTSSAIFRREPLLAAGGFAGSLPYGVEDWDLWLKLAARGEALVCEPEARVRYRRHGSGLTADIAALAEASMAIHEAHAQLVEEPLRRRVRAADLTALARGRVRERRYAEARAALSDAARLASPGGRERLLCVLLAAPGLRRLLGRRAPYG